MFGITAKLLPHFKGFGFSPEIMLLFVYMQCRSSLIYRDLGEMMRIRGAQVDHATLQRWVIRFVPLIEQRERKKPVGNSWRNRPDLC